MSTERLARFVSELTYDKIPPEAIRGAKQAILDCVGVTIAGCDDEGSKIITQFIKGEEGKPEAGIVGTGFKCPASQAAWANGTLAHALDYDDYSATFGGHPSVALLPAVLAVGDQLHLSGKDILVGYIAGFELGSALAPYCVMQSYLLGWHSTSTIGTIGAVGCAANMLKLNLDQCKMALGIGGSLANGLKENFGSMTKPLHAGNAARNGVVAAALSQRGFTANESILEAQQGFIKVITGGAQVDITAMGQNIGDTYAVIDGLSFKPYPSCAGTHTTIDGTMALIEEYGMKIGDVEEVELRTPEGVETATIHNRPQTGLEGKFSNQYVVAAALIDGNVGLHSFTDEKVQRPEVQEFLPKVNYSHPPEFGFGFRSETVMKMKDGRQLSKVIDFPKGFAQNPLTEEDMQNKYKDCASLMLPRDQVECSLDMILNLESLDNISTLMDILTFRGK